MGALPAVMIAVMDALAPHGVKELARGRPLKGLFPAVGDEAKRGFEKWKQSGTKR